MFTLRLLSRIVLRFLEKHWLLLLLLFTLLYLWIVVPVAETKPLWDDEFFTLYISSAPGFAGIWSALATGADQHPPLFFLLHQRILSLLGVNHLTLRLPAIAGVWLMAASLFVFVSRRTSAVWGIAAALFLVTTEAVTYAAEARGYAIVLGCTGTAMLCWQQAALGRKRAAALTGLAASLAGAVCGHYYAVLLLGPFAAAELIRSLRLRKLDPFVWLAFAGMLVPLVFSWPLIAASRAYAATFWARPAWRAALDFYPATHAKLTGAAAIFTVLLVLYQYYGSRQRKPNKISPPNAFTLEEIVLALGLMSLPLAALAAAKLGTNAYHVRYALSGVIGSTVLAIAALHAALQRSREAGSLLACALAVNLIGVSTIERISREEEGGLISRSARFLESAAPSDMPIVISEVLVFHKLSFYAPERLASRLRYVPDPTNSLFYLGHDTIDQGLLTLRPWFPLRIEEYHGYLQENRRFLVYGQANSWTWLTYALIRDGFSLHLIGRNSQRTLLLAERPALTPASVVEREDFSQTSFPLRHLRQPPSPDLSFCSRWFGDRLCVRLNNDTAKLPPNAVFAPVDNRTYQFPVHDVISLLNDRAADSVEEPSTVGAASQ